MNQSELNTISEGLSEGSPEGSSEGQSNNIIDKTTIYKIIVIILLIAFASSKIPIKSIKYLIYAILLLVILAGVYILNKYKNKADFVMKINDTLGRFGNVYQRVRYGYLLSTIFVKDNEVWADYIHNYKGKSTGTWFYASGTPIDININKRSQEAIFVTGPQGQDDALLIYDEKKNIMKNIIKGTGLSSKKATYGAVSIDLDKDGYVDLIVTREDGVILYKNQKNRTFKYIKIMDKQKDYTPIGIAISDYDKDGNPDIFISQFIDYNLAIPNQFDNPSKHAPNVMLKDIGNNKFKDVSKELGLDGRWNTFTSAFIDLNNDSYPDLVQSPDAAKMYIHENVKGSKFIEKENPANSGFWMGIASGDIDNDMDEDLFLTNVGYKFSPEGKFIKGTIKPTSTLNVNHVLLRNDGNFKFVDITKDSGTLKQDFGWGGIFEDINLDSKQDLLFAQNSYFLPNYHLSKSSGAVLINKGEYKFENINDYPNPHFGQTPISVDINKDGIKDIVWINLNGPVKVYKNENKDRNNYINIKLPDNLDFANAIVTITDDKNNKQQKQNIIGGLGMAGDQSNMLSFGLGKNKINNVEIKTMYGKEYKYNNPKTNSTIIINNKL